MNRTHQMRMSISDQSVATVLQLTGAVSGFLQITVNKPPVNGVLRTADCGYTTEAVVFCIGRILLSIEDYFSPVCALDHSNQVNWLRRFSLESLGVSEGPNYRRDIALVGVHFGVEMPDIPGRHFPAQISERGTKLRKLGKCVPPDNRDRIVRGKVVSIVDERYQVQSV